MKVGHLFEWRSVKQKSKLLSSQFLYCLLSERAEMGTPALATLLVTSVLSFFPVKLQTRHLPQVILFDVFAWLPWLVLPFQAAMVFCCLLGVIEKRRQSRIVVPLSLSCPKMLMHSWEISLAPVTELLHLGSSSSCNAGSSLSLWRNIHTGICMWEAVAICPV